MPELRISLKDGVLVEETVEAAAPMQVGRRETRISYVSPREAKILGFFSPSSPCWFPECEALRAKYQADLTQLKTENPNCPPCEEGALIRRYQAILRKLLPE